MGQVPTTAVCLMGPTAVGKTGLALALAARLPVGLVSVDSAMVYRGMDIGSGKPPRETLARVPHRLVDIRDPWEQYSAGEFVRDATKAIGEITAAGCMPLLVGGTMLYFRSLLQGLSALPVADPGTRRQLEDQAAVEGWPALHGELRRVDPVAAARIAVSDRQRIQRALEVYRLTGRPLSALQVANRVPDGIRFLKFAVLPGDRQGLHERIAARLQGMVEEGLVAEVEGLLAMPGMDAGSPALRAVGYRQICAHVRGDTGLDEARRQALAATRQLARRQLTWLRQERCDLAFDMTSPALLSDLERAVRSAVPQMQY